MGSVVPEKIYEVLKKVTDGEIKNFKISIHDTNKKGEGFLGQMFFISLQDQRNGKQLNFVVKQAFSEQNVRKEHPIEEFFHNEIYFYEKLWPMLKKFQERIPPEYRSDNVPKCFGAICDDNFERIVLDNLKYQEFVMHDKKKPLKKDMFEFIFKLYGKFHAISFAYKVADSQKFTELTKEVIDVWDVYTNKFHFRKAIRDAHQQTYDAVQSEVDDAVIEKYKLYVNDGVEIFRKSLINGKYSVITHGDCWSNNMMFKNDEFGNLVDLRLLDFQIIRMASPVCDLSYCLYSGGTKENFDDLNDLLQVYHDSLSESLRAYGYDPQELYPLQELKNDWKVYCHLGVTLALMIWRVKLTDEDNAVDLLDTYNDTGGKSVFTTKFDKNTFRERTRDIIMHLYENNWLFE